MMKPGRRAVMTAAVAAILVSLPGRPAVALTLGEARAQGLVGELPNGYIATRRNGPGVTGLVESVNRQRRQRYRQISAETNAPMAAVEQQAGQALIRRLPSGGWYMNPQNQWVQR